MINVINKIKLRIYRDYYTVNFVMINYFQGNVKEQERLLTASTTLYVGNLSFYTTEEQIHELFCRAGDVKRIIMGLDKYKKTPCGFCFVEYPFISLFLVIVNIYLSKLINLSECM